MRVLKIKKMKRINRLQFTPDGARLLVLGGIEVRATDDAVYLDPTTGEEVTRVEVMSEGAAVSPDGERIASAAPFHRRAGGSLHWRAASDEKWHPLPAAKGSMLQGVAFSPDGEHLAVGRSRQTRYDGHTGWHTSVAIWRLDPPGEVLAFPVATDPVVIEFNRDGALVAVTGGIDGDPMVCIHDTTTGKQRFAVIPKGTQSRGLAFDAAGRLAVVNGKWVSVTPEGGTAPQFVLTSESKQMNAGVFSPDGRRILTGAHDGSLRVWDAADGKPVKSFDWQIGPITAVAFAPDGLTCAASGMKGQVVIWDVDA